MAEDGGVVLRTGRGLAVGLGKLARTEFPGIGAAGRECRVADEAGSGAAVAGATTLGAGSIRVAMAGSCDGARAATTLVEELGRATAGASAVRARGGKQSPNTTPSMSKPPIGGAHF